MPEPVGKCADALIELKNAIKRELDDEYSAAHKYADMAAKFSHFKETKYADSLRLISGHELLHYAVLDTIVEELTKRCEGS